MAHLAAAINRRAFLPKIALGSPRLARHLKPGTWFQSSIRAYSHKTKTKIQIETSELEQEIKQLERMIAEQERKLAGKRALEESIRESKQRSEAAKDVYKSLTSPIATSSPSKQIGANPNSQSYLPETFLQDLKVTFLDTRESKEETIKQLQSELPSGDVLRAASISQDDQETNGEHLEPAPSALTATEKDANVLALERIKKLGVDEWNKLIYVNALDSNFKNAEQVMQLMEEVGVDPNMQSFDYLMEAYCNSNNLQKAESTIELMQTNGLTPSLSAYNSLMKIHVHRRSITSAFHVFEALKEHHNPDVDTFTNLIKGCLRAEEYDLGWKIFDQMQHSGAPPVESTYSTMIQACAKTDQVERALDIFRTYPTRGLQPTDVTFNGLIHACAMRPEYFTTAFALLNEMQNVYGFVPDIATYNTLLFACSKRKELLTARRVFQKVVQLDNEGALKLDGVTVTNFLWCVTEWKDTDVHIRNLKYRLRDPALAQIESAPTVQSEPGTGDDLELTIRPSYFTFPTKPPKDEREALAEGELVFNWFLSRSAEQFPFVEDKDETSIRAAEPEPHEGQEQSDAIVTKTTTTDLAIPRTSRHSPIRTRLLNAYLAMYVRHQDMEKATEIYRRYFDHFQRKRDSWTYSTMLEGCYNWKDVDLGAEVFRDWRSWRLSTGKLTEKRTRQSDYQCYRRMINLLARTNHLDESIALLEELSIAATPVNTRLRSEIASAEASKSLQSSSTSDSTLASASKSELASASTSTSTALAASTGTDMTQLLLQGIEENVLPIYPKLKDFPVVYTKTWELEDEGSRRLLLRLCHGKVDSLHASSASRNNGETSEEQDGDRSIMQEYQDKRRSRYEKALRNTSIKWKGEHPQEKGFYVGSRRIRELERDLSKRGQDHRRGR
ncbi:hypothetical protein BGZ80_000431 [Entomortierella chlamydospora]|uniref:PROP1-like PPR domain-containing protein n=1 Tax=Entomortierella chlamydospora TaxID=101097 RepID=A0A9P6T3P8_9FUNG|nr:hypothetical protein BGZ79_000388 [Entomortierella chlamydospora]KAG0022354.1 hypothetical protein BGZ80_000431 [Entomortierella chlamydospora]